MIIKHYIRFKLSKSKIRLTFYDYDTQIEKCSITVKNLEEIDSYIESLKSIKQEIQEMVNNQ